MGPFQTASLTLLTEEQKATLKQAFLILLQAFKNREPSSQANLAHLGHHFIPLLPGHLQAEPLRQTQILWPPTPDGHFQPSFSSSLLPLLHAFRTAYLAALYPEFQIEIMSQILTLPSEPLKFSESFEVVLMQVAAGRNIEAKNNEGDTALIKAASNENESIIKFLLEYGADVNAKNHDGDTALIKATSNENESIIRLLLGYGAEIDANNNKGDNALIKAASSESTNIIKLLLEYGADLHAALIKAVSSQNESLVKLLLEYGADVNAKNHDGDTALMKATDNESKNIIKLLLGYGAEIDAKNLNGDTALIKAVDNGSEGIVKLLLKHHADIEAKNNYGWTPLVKATDNGDESLVKFLIKKGANIHARADDKTFALMWAAHNGYESIVKFLIKKGADIHARNDYSTVLIEAVRRKNEKIVKFLIKKGADIHARVSGNITALIEAAGRGYESIVELLLKHGADIHAKNDEGDTALIAVAQQGDLNIEVNKRIVNLLLENHADVNAKNKNGATALMWAARSRYGSMVKLLIEKGADINAKDNDSRTALMLAARYGKKQIVKILLRQRTQAGLPQANLGKPGELMTFFENDTELRHLIRSKGGREQVQVVDNALAQADAHDQNVHAWFDAACAHHNFSVLKNFYSDKSPQELNTAYEAFVTAMKNMTHAFQSDSRLLMRCFSDTQVKLGAAHLTRKGVIALERLTSLEMPEEWFRYTAPTGEEVKTVLQDLSLKTALAYLWLAIQDKDFLKAQFPALSDETLKSTTQNAIEGLMQGLVFAQIGYGNGQACAKGLTSKIFHCLEGFASEASIETNATADLAHLTTRTNWILREQKRLALQGELDPASITALMPDMSTFILHHTTQHHPHLLPMLAELLVNKTLYTEIMDPNTSGKSIPIEWEENGKSFTETAHDWQIRQYILGLGKQYFETHYAKHFAGAVQAIPAPRRKDFLLFEQQFGLQAPLAEVDLPDTAANLQKQVNEKTMQLNQAKAGSPALYQAQVEIAYLKALHARQAQAEQNQANIKLTLLKQAETSLQTEIKNLKNELTTLPADSSESIAAKKKLSDLQKHHNQVTQRIEALERTAIEKTETTSAGSATSRIFLSSVTLGKRKRETDKPVEPENGSAASLRPSNP